MIQEVIKKVPKKRKLHILFRNKINKYNTLEDII